MDIKLNTLNFPSKNSTIRSPNLLEHSKKSLQINNYGTQNLLNNSHLATPKDLDHSSSMLFMDKASEQTGGNNRMKQVLSPKIISQQAQSNHSQIIK